MAEDSGKGGFIVLLLLFVTRILCLVFSLNLVRIILGWDGLGLVSFLLVVFYRNTKSARASTITALTNRLGDGAILVLLGVVCGRGL